AESASGSVQQRRGREARHAAKAVEAERDLVEIAPAPVLARLERANNRMRCSVVVSGCVTVGRVIAAADVTAGEADPQVQPLAAVAEALLAAVDGGWELS